MNRKEIAIAITLLIFYIYYHNIPHYADRYLYLTYNIVDNKQLNVDRDHDKFVDVSYRDGHYYTAANPALSFLAVPIYSVMKLFHPFILRFMQNPYTLYHFAINLFINNFLTCFMVVLFYRYLQYFRISEKKRLLLTISLGLGTIIFTYTLEYFASSTVGTFFAFYSFYLLLPDKDDTAGYFNPSVKRLLLSGFFCGMCIFTSYEHSFFIFVFYIYLLTRLKYRSMLYYSSTLSIGFLLLMLYQKECFGGYLTTFQKYMVKQEFIDMTEKGFMGFGKFNWAVFAQLSFGKWRGYFTYMPVMLLPLFGCFFYFYEKIKQSVKVDKIIRLPAGAVRENAFGVILLLTYFIALSSSTLWESGTSYGPRYFVITLPFFLPFAVYAFKYIPNSLILFVAGISIFSNWLGAQFRYQHHTNVTSFIGYFTENGPSSAITTRLAKHFSLPQPSSVIVMNLIFLISALLFLWWMWTKSPLAKDKEADSARLVCNSDN